MIYQSINLPFQPFERPDLIYYDKPLQEILQVQLLSSLICHFYNAKFEYYTYTANLGYLTGLNCCSLFLQIIYLQC